MTFRRGCCILVGFGTRDSSGQRQKFGNDFLVRTTLMGMGQTLVRWMKSKEAKDGESRDHQRLRGGYKRRLKQREIRWNRRKGRGMQKQVSS